MATPAHYSSLATPMHPGMTPGREAITKTPAYDPAWAGATPAHPGFGGGLVAGVTGGGPMGIGPPRCAALCCIALHGSEGQQVHCRRD